jgi:hypothetical protein
VRHGHSATYRVDCGTPSITAASPDKLFNTLAQVNALRLAAGDTLLFKRGTTCKGALQPQGSGTESAPIRMTAYGEGSLPRIIADRADEAVLRLSNEQYWEVQSLDLSGSNTYGILVESAAGTMHHIFLRDLLVHDVRGALKHKESGLVVVHSIKPSGNFDDILVDGVQAFNTTQWSGIFISDATHVQVINTIAHDVQGDGIVVFRSRNALIARSLTWHTGMQHQETLGTPNAIWTWRCTDCVVEDNEAFLADSPGVDGGAFDIDYGNSHNTVRRNFGHDTDGYCVSVFAAFGPTTASVVEGNLCRSNGLAPRLAQRQGAILLMTWQGGLIDGLVVKNNRVDWNPAGDTPAVRCGADLQSTGVVLAENEIHSFGISFIDPGLKYTGSRNIYSIASRVPFDLTAAKTRFLKLPESNSMLQTAEGPAVVSSLGPGAPAWSLIARAPYYGSERDTLRALLVQLLSAALQFGHTGLRVTLEGDTDVLALAADWQLPAAGVAVTAQAPVGQPPANLVSLVSPGGEVAHEWNNYPGPVDLGTALSDHLGAPNFSFLPFEDVRATD